MVFYPSTPPSPSLHSARRPPSAAPRSSFPLSLRCDTGLAYKVKISGRFNLLADHLRTFPNSAPVRPDTWPDGKIRRSASRRAESRVPNGDGAIVTDEPRRVPFGIERRKCGGRLGAAPFPVSFARPEDIRRRNGTGEENNRASLVFQVISRCA